MNCFTHRDTPAVAICKHCGKGLCGDCARESSSGVSCEGDCAARVLEGRAVSHWTYVERRRVIRRRLLEAIVASAIGILLLVGAASTYPGNLGGAIFLFLFGALFLGLGVHQHGLYVQERRGPVTGSRESER
jgi:hypothetical protein